METCINTRFSFVGFLLVLKEVIVATATDVKSWGIEEGVYIVGTGSTGMR